MATKKTTTKKAIDQGKIVIEKQSLIDDVMHKNIIIKSHKDGDKYNDVSYLIDMDGTVERTTSVIDDAIIISIKGGNNVTWTQIKSMIKLIDKLRDNGAKQIKRFDEYKSGSVNPFFNLNQALIKFSVR